MMSLQDPLAVLTGLNACSPVPNTKCVLSFKRLALGKDIYANTVFSL